MDTCKITLYVSLIFFFANKDKEYSSEMLSLRITVLGELLIQDGRVEWRALIPFCENTKITTSCWTAIERNPPKNDNLCPKTKKKLQWDGRRGTIIIKSNSIPAGWANHRLEKNNTKEDRCLLWKFWTPCQASSLGILQRDWGSPGNLTLKASRIWL